MVWFTARGVPYATEGARMRAPSGLPADEAQAPCADLSGAEDQQEAPGTQDLPLPHQGSVQEQVLILDEEEPIAFGADRALEGGAAS